jgi:hypothetical protein
MRAPCSPSARSVAYERSIPGRKTRFDQAEERPLGDPEQTAERWFHERATLYVETQILFHLNQVGVIADLANAGEARDLEALAQPRDLDRRILETLLDYVCGVDSILTRTPSGYLLTDFGRAVIARYGKETAEGLQVNMFDVRTGAYGPVWAKLSGLLTGDEIYGETLHRAGSFAERGLYTSAKGMAPALLEALPQRPCSVVELGVETGLLECVGRARPEVQLFGLDRDRDALEKCARLAAREGVEGVTWIHGDLFDPQAWAERLPRDRPGVLYTIHFHEFMAAGRDALVELVQNLIQLLPGWQLVAIEQPRLENEARGLISSSRWLYSQSNILIHHLIKNGQILSRDEWTEIFKDGGATIQKVSPAGYLDYLAFVVRLGDGAGAP